MYDLLETILRVQKIYHYAGKLYWVLQLVNYNNTKITSIFYNLSIKFLTYAYQDCVPEIIKWKKNARLSELQVFKFASG